LIESEKALEKKLREAIKGAGGWSIKLLSVHITGLPDRLCLLPGGRAVFAEVKTTKKKPTKIQLAVHSKLESLGFPVFVVDSSEGVQKIIGKVNN
jgi:hypothetical protein